MGEDGNWARSGKGTVRQRALMHVMTRPDGLTSSIHPLVLNSTTECFKSPPNFQCESATEFVINLVGQDRVASTHCIEKVCPDDIHCQLMVISWSSKLQPWTNEDKCHTQIWINS